MTNPKISLALAEQLVLAEPKLGSCILDETSTHRYVQTIHKPRVYSGNLSLIVETHEIFRKSDGQLAKKWYCITYPANMTKHGVTIAKFVDESTVRVFTSSGCILDIKI